MEHFFTGLRALHVLAGAVGLLLFWLPIFSRKGSPWHRRAGRGFLVCVNVIGWTALVSVTARLLLASLHGTGWRDLPAVDFLLLLGYLGLTVLIGGWYMRHVVRAKADPVQLRRPLAWTLAAVSVCSSLLLLWVAYRVASPATPLLYALSSLGLLNGWTMRRHLRAPEREPQAWFFEHMGHGIGLGIAFHAAFFVFGARSMFDTWLVGVWGLLPWLAPVVIGIGANLLWERHYRRQFQAMRPR